MKKLCKTGLSLVVSLVLVLCLFGCRDDTPKNLWEDAVYTEDTALGEGTLTFTLKVEVDDKSVIFTVRTDETNLEKALVEVDLIAGEQSAYGLYIKKVNGMTADYDEDQTYWKLVVNGKDSQTGVSGVTLTDGGDYALIRTK